MERTEKRIFTVYAEKDDMTFIMAEDYAETECVGWYFGEPDPEATAKFTGSLRAVYDK